MTRARHIVAAALVLGAQGAAAMDMAEAVALCLDDSLTLGTRAEALVDGGWSPEPPEASDDALLHGLILTGLIAHQPDTWAGTQLNASRVAFRVRSGRGYDGVQTFSKPGALLVLEPNNRRRGTCLYAGTETTLDEIKPLWPADQDAATGSHQIVRNDLPTGVIFAAVLGREAADTFPDPLTYTAVVTTVLNTRDESLP